MTVMTLPSWDVHVTPSTSCKPEHAEIWLGRSGSSLPLHGYMIKSLTLCCWIWPRKTCHQNNEVSRMWSKVEGIQRKNQEAMCSYICLPFLPQKCPISIFFATSTPWIRIQEISQKDKPENSKWSRCLSWWILSDIPKRQKKKKKNTWHC